uniref:Uncharacterized protein n=1 Tax=Acrobeloides nanus TaxID=290746 RepID=A0A914C7S6_9BILA
MPFIITAFLGATQALLLISSLGTTSDLINENTESGAFVYGAMSLMDKLTNGIAYQIIELLNPNCDPKTSHECGNFYRNIMVFVPGACVVLIVLVLLTFNAAQVGIRRRETRSNIGESDHQQLITE